MTLNFKITEADYIAYNMFHSKNSATIKRTLLLSQILLVALTTCGGFIIRLPVGIVCFVLSAIVALLLPKFHWWFTEWTVRKIISEGKANEFVGDSVLVLGEETIRGETNGRITEVSYDKIERIPDDGERYYIYIGSITAFIVPFSAFADAQQKKEVLELLESKKKTNSLPAIDEQSKGGEG